MAQSKQKRKRKHRGTPAGTIERPAHNAGARTKEKAKQKTKPSADQRREERLNREPTWRGAINRAAIAAGVFAVITVLLLKQSVAQALALGAFAFLLYVPSGYYIDRALYNRRQRQQGKSGK